MSRILCIIAIAACAARAADLLSNVFADNMVLRWDGPRLFGWTSPLAKVTVTVDSLAEMEVRAKEDGFWEAELGSRKRADRIAGIHMGHHVSVSDGTSTASLSGVLFGNVYLCIGQDNMDFPLNQDENNDTEIEAASKYTGIRLLKLKATTSLLQQAELTATPVVAWGAPSASRVSVFSAVCWYYARALADEHGTAIGLIQASQPDTVAEEWTPRDSVKSCSCTSPHGSYYNAMIAPLQNLHLSAVVMYQGEGNVLKPSCFKCIFVAQIKALRDAFTRGNVSDTLPFLFVVTAPWEDKTLGEDVPQLRLSELEALNLPYVCAASATDLGDAGSSREPRSKTMVGVRLGLCAQRYVHQITGTVCEGPSPHSISVKMSGKQAAVSLTFQANTVGSGLKLHNEPICPFPLDLSACSVAWQVLGDNEKWYDYSAASLTGERAITITAVMPSGVNAIGLRYTYAQWPRCVVYNAEGLPALPFVMMVDNF